MTLSSTSRKTHDFRSFYLLVHGSRRLKGVVCDQSQGCASTAITKC